MKEIDNKLTQKFDEYPSFGVLKGVKVFVTGTNIAGPFAGCLMAEMGAKVLQAAARGLGPGAGGAQVHGLCLCGAQGGKLILRQLPPGV